MKGLFLNNMDKKEEAYEHVKRGLKFDLTSHICEQLSSFLIYVRLYCFLALTLITDNQAGTSMASSTAPTRTTKKPRTATHTPSSITRMIYKF